MLDDESRSLLESGIDAFVKDVPPEIRARAFRNVHSLLQVKEPDDLVLGVAIGYILSPFNRKYMEKYGRRPNVEEYGEITVILINRSNEIREAISKAS
jgi:hypothetical protein